MNTLTDKEIYALRQEFDCTRDYYCSHCENMAYVQTPTDCKCEECYKAAHPLETIDDLREKGRAFFLYHIAYYDGPLTGVMLWEGKRCYFKMVEEASDGILVYTKETWESIIRCCKTMDLQRTKDCVERSSSKNYEVYELPEDMLEQVDRSHDLFVRYVGFHTDYDYQGKRPIGGLRPYSGHNNFYNDPNKKCCYALDLTKATLIGKFRR